MIRETKLEPIMKKRSYFTERKYLAFIFLFFGSLQQRYLQKTSFLSRIWMHWGSVFFRIAHSKGLDVCEKKNFGRHEQRKRNDENFFEEVCSWFMEALPLGYKTIFSANGFSLLLFLPSLLVWHTQAKPARQRPSKGCFWHLMETNKPSNWRKYEVRGWTTFYSQRAPLIFVGISLYKLFHQFFLGKKE